MERAYLCTRRTRLKGDGTLFHLICRFFGEGNGKNLRRVYAALLNQKRNFRRDDARLSGTGSRQNQKRHPRMHDGFALLIVQGLKIIPYHLRSAPPEQISTATEPRPRSAGSRR